MFANFELWSGGMVEYSAESRQPRSTRACLTCRHIKKKCDGQEPTCGRCKSQARGGECSWPPSPSVSSVSSLSSSPSPSRQRASPPSSAASTSLADPGSAPVPDAASVLGSALGSMQPSVSAVLRLPVDVPGVTTALAWELVRQANRPIHGAYFDDRYTILVPCLPLMAKFPSYMHAWLALGAVYITQQQQQEQEQQQLQVEQQQLQLQVQHRRQHQSLPADSRWRHTALWCYSKAIRGLHDHLGSAPVPHEWALCAVLLLHMFEKFGSIGSDRSAPSDAHLESARTVFARRFSALPPTNERHMLELESLVYRIAITSTFQSRPTSYREYSSLDELVDIWACASSRIPSGPWQHSLWIGLPPAMFNIVFKLSVLLRLDADVPWGVVEMELDRLQDELEQYQRVHTPPPPPPPLRAVDRCRDAVDAEAPSQLSLADQCRAAHCLYIYAGIIMIARLRRGGAADGQWRTDSQSQTDIRRASRHGSRLLHQLTRSQFVSPVLLWPTIILGLSALTVDDRLIVETYVNRLQHLSGSRTIASVRRLLEHAWSRRGTPNEPGSWVGGMDVLFDKEALADVFL